jgi:transcription termination factor Rho
LPGLPLHSILQYTGGLDGSDLDAFRDQQFLVIARAVPEPGALTAMAAAVLVIGTAALRRRRQ